MIFIDALRSSAEILRTNKIRLALTLMGIVIGIATTVTALAIDRGAKLLLGNDLTESRRNAIFVQRDQGRAGGRTPPILDLEDARLISRVDGVKRIALSWIGDGNVNYGRRSGKFSLAGVTPEYARLRNLKLESGRFITPYDVHARSKVCVISAQIEKELFPDKVYLGKKIEINARLFEVVGKFESLESRSIFARRLKYRDDRIFREDHIFVPITVAEENVRSHGFEDIYLEYSPGFQHSRNNIPFWMNQRIIEFFRPSFVQENRELDEIKIRIENILALRKGSGHRYTLVTLNDSLKEILRVLWIINLVLGGVAVLSLLFGGVGIMNFMTLSVTDRVHEIAIRKTVGASRRDILGQFLVETILLTLSAGATGILLGFFASRIMAAIWDIPISVAWWSALIGLALTSLLGLIFGIYPAHRAAGLDPVQALRH